MSTPESFAVPAGSVVITPTELYREMQATHTIVSEMRGDLRELARAIPDHESRIRGSETRVQQNTEKIAEVTSDVGDHETRLRAVERKLWLVAGFAAGGGGAVSAVVTKLLGG